MIESFKDRRLKRFYERGDRSRLQPALIEMIELILSLLENALTLDDLDVHSLHLHPLTGDRKGVLERDRSCKLADHIPL